MIMSYKTMQLQKRALIRYQRSLLWDKHDGRVKTPEGINIDTELSDIRQALDNITHVARQIEVNEEIGES